MSILKITVSSQVFADNEVLATDEVGVVKGGDESIEKCGKLLKTRELSNNLKLSKSGNSKGKKSAKSKKTVKK